MVAGVMEPPWQQRGQQQQQTCMSLSMQADEVQFGGESSPCGAPTTVSFSWLSPRQGMGLYTFDSLPLRWA